MNAADVLQSYRPGLLPEDPPKVPKRCGAKCKRTGQPCKNWAIWPSGRCRMHRGKAARGFAHYNYRHGRRSRDLVARMVSDYEAHLAEHEAGMGRALPAFERFLDNMGTSPANLPAEGAETSGPEFSARRVNSAPVAEIK